MDSIFHNYHYKEKAAGTNVSNGYPDFVAGIQITVQ